MTCRSQERYAAECSAPEGKVAHRRQLLNEPPSRVVLEEQTESLRKFAG